MDAKIQAGIEAGIKKERDRMEAIAVAKDHVRGRVGNLSMAFDSAAQVYSKAIEVASGKKPPKEANIEMLKFAFDALPPKVRQLRHPHPDLFGQALLLGLGWGDGRAGNRAGNRIVGGRQGRGHLRHRGVVPGVLPVPPGERQNEESFGDH